MAFTYQVCRRGMCTVRIRILPSLVGHVVACSHEASAVRVPIGVAAAVIPIAVSKLMQLHYGDESE